MWKGGLFTLTWWDPPSPTLPSSDSHLQLSSLTQGVANFYKDTKKHIITTQTEHKCVLDSCRCVWGGVGRGRGGEGGKGSP